MGLDTQQLLPLSGSQELRQAGPRLKVGEVLPPLPGGSSVGYWKLVPSPNTLVLDSVTGRLLTDGQGRLERQGVLVVALGSAPGTPNWGGLLGRVYKQGLTPAERSLLRPRPCPAAAAARLCHCYGCRAFDVLYLVDPSRSCMGATAGLLLAPLAHSVLAFTPQVDLASSCMRPGASSTALAGLRAQVEAAVEAAARQGCRISVLVGTWQHDLDQANLLPPDQVRHKVFGLDSHRLALHLDSKGELLPLVREHLHAALGMAPKASVRLANLL
ncbi:hypothetical protein V8C86DRAFT_3035620 [Haematococcus lacustris]